jgi:hypothetical protein
MRFLLLFLVACGPGGDPLVVVTVDSALQLHGVAALRTTTTAAGHVASAFDATAIDGSGDGGAGAFDIPPSHTFGVEIPEAYAGDFRLTVDAVDRSGQVLASGSGETTTFVGKRSDLQLTLDRGTK